MPTLVIPCSDPKPAPYTVVDDHFLPLGTPYAPALVQAYTDTLPGALTDPTGDAGYLYLDIAGYEAAELAAGGTSPGYGLGTAGAAVPTPVTIAADQVTGVRAVATARAVSGVHSPNIAGDRLQRGGYGDAANWAPGTFYGPMPAGWTTYTSAPSSNLWTIPGLWSDFIGRAAAGALSVEFVPSRTVGEPQGVVHVAWLAIEIDYTVAGAPPLRQYPRTDGLATSSARRLYPVSRSRQGSLRHGGGTYL